ADLWKAIEALDNEVDDAVQSAMLLDTSRLIGRGTTWFLRSRRLAEDMAATIAHFTPQVAALATRLPQLLDPGERVRIDTAVAAYVAKGVPQPLATRVVAFDTLYAALDIVEVAGTAKRAVAARAESSRRGPQRAGPLCRRLRPTPGVDAAVHSGPLRGLRNLASRVWGGGRLAATRRRSGTARPPGRPAEATRAVARARR